MQEDLEFQARLKPETLSQKKRKSSNCRHPSIYSGHKDALFLQ
jgi:hypothetical protein